MTGGRSGSIELKAGHISMITAEAGYEYAIIRKKKDTAEDEVPLEDADDLFVAINSLPAPAAGELADHVLASQMEQDLKLVYDDGATLIIQDFFTVCRGDSACSVALPGIRLTGDIPLGVSLGSDSHLIYAHGYRDCFVAHG